MVMVTHDAHAARRSPTACSSSPTAVIVEELPRSAAREILAAMGRAAPMIRVALAGLLGRKLRTALTALAIVLGVAMVSGTFVLTDSIDKAFNSIFTRRPPGLRRRRSRGKAAVRPQQRQRDRSRRPFDRVAARRRCAALPDVDAAEGSVNGEAQLIGHNGKAIVFGGAPNLGFSIDQRRARRSTRSRSSPAPGRRPARS